VLSPTKQGESNASRYHLIHPEKNGISLSVTGQTVSDLSSDLLHSEERHSTANPLTAKADLSEDGLPSIAAVSLHFITELFYHILQKKSRIFFKKTFCFPKK
jgi:hypothetical protein